MASTTILSTGIKYPQSSSYRIKSPGFPSPGISASANITGSPDGKYLYFTASAAEISPLFDTPWFETYNYSFNLPTGSKSSIAVIKGFKVSVTAKEIASTNDGLDYITSAFTVTPNYLITSSTYDYPLGDVLATAEDDPMDKNPQWHLTSSVKLMGDSQSIEGNYSSPSFNTPSPSTIKWTSEMINSPNFGVSWYAQGTPAVVSPITGAIDSVGIEVFYSIITNLGRKEYNVEFQDTNLGLQGWTNPRWDGCKLIGKEVNKYTDTPFTDSSGTSYSKDITYGLEPVVERKGTALYFGTTLQGYNDDPIFNGFPDWSYLSLSKMLVIDTDNDSVLTIDPDAFNYTAFDRIFKEDFGTGNKFKVKILDPETETNLDNVKNGTAQIQKSFLFPNYKPEEQGYTSQFNEGRLAKVAVYSTGSTNGFVSGLYSTGSDGNITYNVFNYGNPPPSSVLSVVKNYEVNVPNQYASFWTGSSTITDLDEFYTQVVRQIDSGSDFYVTFNSGSSGKWPNFQPGIIGKGTVRLGNNLNTATNFIYNSPTPTSLPNYFTSISEITSGPTTAAYTFSQNNSDYQLSSLTPGNNVVLADLNKPQELPNGIGKKGFIIIPNNLKKEIRDNLDFYLAKVGLSDNPSTSKTS